MAYTDVLKANADMFDKTAKMLEYDKLSSLPLSEQDEYKDEMLINEKITRLINEKKLILKE